MIFSSGGLLLGAQPHLLSNISFKPYSSVQWIMLCSYNLLQWSPSSSARCHTPPCPHATQSSPVKHNCAYGVALGPPSSEITSFASLHQIHQTGPFWIFQLPLHVDTQKKNDVARTTSNYHPAQLKVHFPPAPHLRLQLPCPFS